MRNLNYDDIIAAWGQIARFQDKEMELSFKLKIQKRILDIFQVGDYYYYIFNPATVQFEFVSEKCQKHLQTRRPFRFHGTIHL